MIAEGSARSFKAQVPMGGGRGITLEVLRTEGADALSTSGIEGLQVARLAKVEVTYQNTFHDVKVFTSADVFDALETEKHQLMSIPKTGKLTGALLMLQFADSPNPVPVEIKVPNLFSFPEDGHANQIRRWFASSHFVRPNSEDGAGETTSRCKTPGDHSKNFPA
jgi:hypothetical protein